MSKKHKNKKIASNAIKPNGKKKFVKTTKFKVILLSAIMLISILAVIVVGLLVLTGRINSDIGRKWGILDSIEDGIDDPDADYIDLSVDFPEGSFMSDKSVKNILIIGSDTRGNETYGRSDTMMLVSIDSKNKKLKMTSFLRDTYVKIPGKNANRLNAAYQYGGPPLLIDTLEQNFGIDIDNYVRTDFESFTKIIDILGGVTIDLTEAEANHLPRINGDAGLSAGIQKLNGKNALAYSRIRKIDSDFGRVQRQRNVIDSLINEFKTSSPTKMVEVLNKSLELFSTDMKQKDLMLLAKDSITIMNYDMEQLSIPVQGGYTSQTIRQMAVLVPDIQLNMSEVQKFIYG